MRLHWRKESERDEEIQAHVDLEILLPSISPPISPTTFRREWIGAWYFTDSRQRQRA